MIESDSIPVPLFYRFDRFCSFTRCFFLGQGNLYNPDSISFIPQVYNVLQNRSTLFSWEWHCCFISKENYGLFLLFLFVPRTTLMKSAELHFNKSISGDMHFLFDILSNYIYNVFLVLVLQVAPSRSLVHRQSKTTFSPRGACFEQLTLSTWQKMIL